MKFLLGSLIVIKIGMSKYRRLCETSRKITVSAKGKQGKHVAHILNGHGRKIFTSINGIDFRDHAEISVIRNMFGKEVKERTRKKYTIMVLRFLANGELTDSKPCLMCLKCIQVSGMQTIIYSTGDGELEMCKLKDMIKRQDICFTKAMAKLKNGHKCMNHIIREFFKE